ncbi:uncharacterized protein LOC130665747 [Microplitis mediator]|uniref:uncharacterized protein LOC130665747 n=1 Tax=Microplitis mediator TaxID=375433 RepID=UPI0025547A3F|nr:uncharacterized protein LOC130665747 [Microplitis mediator]XP_057322279.1 uncharacterized protein LOC130665747 [Microplitis mediator]
MRYKEQDETVMSDNDNIDVNEVFENLLLAEDIAEKTGFEKGVEAGKSQLLKGYHLGYHRASVLAAQLGYYSGIVEYCLNEKSLSSKAIEQAKKLKDEIKQFPKTNDETFDIIKHSEDIKFKFTKLCSLAKINAAYPEAEKLDF